MDEILSSLLPLISDHVLPHWPFLVTLIIFAVIGQFTSKSVFTREKAYKKQKGPWYRPWENQHFWWWGRETLCLHPIVVGALVGILWQNPEGASPAWELIASVGYFSGSGASSLLVWSLLRAYLRQKGINFDLPGGTSSDTPPPPSEEIDVSSI